MSTIEQKPENDLIELLQDLRKQDPHADLDELLEIIVGRCEHDARLRRAVIKAALVDEMNRMRRASH